MARLICNDGHHNKFWSYQIQDDTSVEIIWGRIGTPGSRQTRTFPNHRAMMKFIDKKVNEKMAKGYHEMADQEFNEETQKAKAIGHQYKIIDVQWVERAGRGVKTASDKSGAMVQATLQNSWSKETMTLVISRDTAFVLENDRLRPAPPKAPIEGLRSIFKNLQTAAQKVFKSIVALQVTGGRVLDLEQDDSAEVAGEIRDQFGTMMEAIDEVCDQFEAVMERQAVKKFISLGERMLDL